MRAKPLLMHETQALNKNCKKGFVMLQPEKALLSYALVLSACFLLLYEV